MLRHRNIDRICCIVLAAVLLIACAYMGAGAAGWIVPERTIGYENRLFDTARVHTLDIVIEDWDGFLASCTDEEYVPCHVVIDGESYKNVAIRAKGNTSLSSVQQYGNNRYSIKIEFDHYQTGGSYHGLDKLSLNNLIQDNTYMKDYFAYSLMRKGGSAAPLCSFVQINVNGEPWGLYLAVEGVEDSFLRRNFGNDTGELYKPDSMSFGAGRGNGKGFDMEDFRQRMEEETEAGGENDAGGAAPPDRMIPPGMVPPEGQTGFQPGMTLSGEDQPTFPEGMIPPGEGQPAFSQGMIPPSEDQPALPAGSVDAPQSQQGQQRSRDARGGGRGMSSPDVLLQYTDDDPASYSNIFDNAKTDVNEADQQRLIQSLKALSEGDASVVDQQAVIRYLAVHNFLCNDDSYTGAMVHNYYLYEKDGVLSMLPWDYNLAFGGFGMGGGFGTSGATSTVNQPIDSPVTSGELTSRPIISWIFQSDETLSAYHAAYEQFISEAFDSGWFADEIDRVSALIAPYVQADPTAFCTYEDFQQGVETLRTFCLLRAQSVAGQLSGVIPATSEGQRVTDALVDASQLNLSDMGSMGNTHGGQPGGFGGRDHSQNPPDAGSFPGAGRGRDKGTRDRASGSGEAPSQPAGANAESAGTVAAPNADSSFAQFAVPPGGNPLESSSPTQPTASRPADSGNPFGEGISSTSRESWALLGVCAAVLLGAILLVSKYKSNL